MASDILKISCYKNSEILPSEKTPVTVSEDYWNFASSKTGPVKLNCIWEFRVDLTPSKTYSTFFLFYDSNYIDNS